jgi:hypothetical protein
MPSDKPTSGAGASQTSHPAEAAWQQQGAAPVESSQAAQLPASEQPPLSEAMLDGQPDNDNAASESELETELGRSPSDESSLAWQDVAEILGEPEVAGSDVHLQTSPAASVLTTNVRSLTDNIISEMIIYGLLQMQWILFGQYKCHSLLIPAAVGMYGYCIRVDQAGRFIFSNT